tara:strand:+ start:18860 stop:19150 length:291 start_codon:yes stop_codon:yes gene_type:complete
MRIAVLQAIESTVVLLETLMSRATTLIAQPIAILLSETNFSFIVVVSPSIASQPVRPYYVLSSRRICPERKCHDEELVWSFYCRSSRGIVIKSPAI